MARTLWAYGDAATGGWRTTVAEGIHDDQIIGMAMMTVPMEQAALVIGGALAVGYLITAIVRRSPRVAIIGIILTAMIGLWAVYVFTRSSPASAPPPAPKTSTPSER